MCATSFADSSGNILSYDACSAQFPWDSFWLLRGLPTGCMVVRETKLQQPQVISVPKHGQQDPTRREFLQRPILVGGLEHFLFFHILTFIFFRGVETTNQHKPTWINMAICNFREQQGWHWLDPSERCQSLPGSQAQQRK